MIRLEDLIGLENLIRPEDLIGLGNLIGNWGATPPSALLQQVVIIA